MLLLIDNYDSFVYNLARYFERLGHTTRVVRNTAIDLAGASALAPEAIVLSPGPCGPKQAGCSLPLVRAFCMTVTGCKSTTRVVSCRYSCGDGGSSWYLPSRFTGSLNAQCLISPCPPCITAQRTPSQLLIYALVSGGHNSGNTDSHGLLYRRFDFNCSVY